jgi:hypothetical protein
MKLLSLLTSLGFLALSSVASAQATRTWVSGVGDDVNPCSRTAPGKTFAGAISKTAAKGVISILDPGGFGTVTITKSITIDGGGTEGSILASLANGVIINAAATDVVILRNLTIDGVGNGLAGVRILSAGAVYIENCRIRLMTTGIEDVTTALTGTQIFVKDTLIEECSGNGISMTPGATSASALVLSNSQIQGCNRGIVVNPRAKAILDGSTIAFNTLDGIQRVAPGVVQTFKNNKVFGNTPDGVANGVLKVK